MKEQRKGCYAGVAGKQQKNNEKQQFALQYRGNISKDFLEAEKNSSRTDKYTLGNLRAVYLD